MPKDWSLHPAITLPLAEVERLIALVDILGIQYLKPRDRDALALVKREVEQVKGMVGDMLP